MTRMRWKVADMPVLCRHCYGGIERGEIHIGWICSRCSVPFVADSDFQWWVDLYHTELTRAVRARLGLEPDSS